MSTESKVDVCLKQICSLRPPHIEFHSRYDLVKGVFFQMRRPEFKYIYRGQVFSGLAIFARVKYDLPVTSGTHTEERDAALHELHTRAPDAPYPAKPEIGVLPSDNVDAWYVVDGPVDVAPAEFRDFIDEYTADRVKRGRPHSCSSSFPLMMSRFAMGTFTNFIVYNCFELTHFWHRIEYAHMHEYVALQPVWATKFHSTPLMTRLPLVPEVALTMDSLRVGDDETNAVLLQSFALPVSAPKWVGYEKSIGMIGVTLRNKDGSEEPIDPVRVVGDVLDMDDGGVDDAVLWEEGHFAEWRDFRVVVKPEGAKLTLLVQRELTRREEVPEHLVVGDVDGGATPPPCAIGDFFDADAPRFAAYVEMLLARDASSNLEVESISVVSSRTLRADVGFVWLLLAERPYLVLPNLEGELPRGNKAVVAPYKLPTLFDSLMIHNRKLQEEAAKRRRARQAQRLKEREARRAKIEAAKAEDEARRKQEEAAKAAAVLDDQAKKQYARELFAKQLHRFRERRAEEAARQADDGGGEEETTTTATATTTPPPSTDLDPALAAVGTPEEKSAAAGDSETDEDQAKGGEE